MTIIIIEGDHGIMDSNLRRMLTENMEFVGLEARVQTMLDELSGTDFEVVTVDSIPKELVLGTGRMFSGLADYFMLNAEPYAVAYKASDRNYEKNPPRVPKNLKQTKAPKQNFRAQMRSVNRNR